MNEYTQITGLKLNEEKCGSIQLQPSMVTSEMNDVSASVLLPRKDVSWGLLTLQSSGRFIINQKALISFLDEMKVRLTNASTILEWINLYNQYVSHFMRNFGKCANILGTYHTEQMIKTFQFLHHYVFPETNGNALTTLTNRIVEQFPSCLSDGICEAWFYWPLTQGGLGLKNIYLTLYSVHNWLLSEKIGTFTHLPAEDAERYADIVEKYEYSKKHHQDDFLKKFLHDDGTLITFVKYIQGRESHLSHWKRVYTKMLAVAQLLPPAVTNNFANQIDIVRKGIRKVSSNIDDDNYIEWLVCYYGGQIESTFNQLDFLDSDILPIGLITLMKTTKIDWNNHQ